MIICGVFCISFLCLFCLSVFYWGVDVFREARPSYGGGVCWQPLKYPHSVSHLGVSFTENPTCGKMPASVVILRRTTLSILGPNRCCKCNRFHTPKKVEVKISFFFHILWFQPFPLDGRSWIWDPTVNAPLGWNKFLGPESTKVLVAVSIWSSVTFYPHCLPWEIPYMLSLLIFKLKMNHPLFPFKVIFTYYFSVFIWCTGIIWLFCACWTWERSVTCQVCQTHHTGVFTPLLSHAK